MILFIFALCSFAASTSSRVADPLTNLIAADYGVAIAQAALLSSAYALPFALFQPLLGPIGDMWGKSRLLRTALWITAFSLIAGAFAPSLAVLLVLRFVGGFAGGGTVPSGMALLGDRYSGKDRQVAIGRFVGAGLFGQIFSASMAGVVAVWLGWRNTFLLAGVVAIVAALAATFYLREAPDAPRRTFSLAGAIDGYRMVFANPRAYVCFATVCAEGIALWGVMPFVAELLISSGSGTTREAGFVIGGIGVGGLAFTILLPMLLRIIGRTVMMGVGGVLGTAGLIGLVLDLDWAMVAGLFCVSGFGYMMLHNSIQNESVELAPMARSSSYSMHAFFFFTGQSLGPVLFGLVYGFAGAETALYLCAALFAITGVIAGAMLAVLDKR